MKRFTYIFLIAIALVSAFGFGCYFGNRNIEHACTVGETHMIGTWASFDYSVLCSLDSNQIDIARGMLKRDIFANIKIMWVNSAESGDITDMAIRKHILKLYPALRNRVPLSEFEVYPIPIQREMKKFVSEADEFV